MVIRENWLKKIRPFYENELVKVLIGIRRCGKSVILRQIADEIKADDLHKIFINFEDLNFASLKDEISLFEYVKNLMTDEKKYYLFFDEIQNVANFEKAVNSFRLFEYEHFSSQAQMQILCPARWRRCFPDAMFHLKFCRSLLRKALKFRE
ncbi:MAG: AAA family ATPase [Treponema succinifaciens]|nr:MAG: AAA family ATPase [Treponema succinifaciens]